MPPKAKSQKGKGKSSTTEDVLSTEEMSKDQLEKHIVRLREELNREREEKSYFQLERDRIRAIWDISKRNLEEVKAEQRNRCREREEAKERHRVEITDEKLLKLRADHGVSTAQRKYNHLRESLQKAEQQLLELQKQLKEYNLTEAQRAAARAYVKVFEKDLRDVTVQHELLLQAFQKMQLERDELLQRQTEAIVAMQQRSGLKELLLQRKLATVTETLEKEEARLCTALSASNIEPTASSSATNTLQGLLASKHVTISALQDDVARESKEYEDLWTGPEGPAARPRLQAHRADPEQTELQNLNSSRTPPGLPPLPHSITS